MKALGSVLLAAGFLAGAYASVSRVDSVSWPWYGACAFVMLAGMAALHTARIAARAEAGDKHTADVAILQESLTRLTEKVRAFEAAAGDEDQLALHHRIDDELVEDVATFVDARESMIPTLGMQRYADVMSPFANAERLLNRAWSASADGYVDEVRLCVRNARLELEKAAAELAAGASS